MVENIVLSCLLKVKSYCLGPPLAQNLETEECPRYPACNLYIYILYIYISIYIYIHLYIYIYISKGLFYSIAAHFSKKGAMFANQQTLRKLCCAINIDINIFAQLFRIKFRLLGIKYLLFWEETKWLR